MNNAMIASPQRREMECREVLGDLCISVAFPRPMRAVLSDRLRGM